MPRAVQGLGNWALSNKNFQVLGRGPAGLEFLVARVRGKALAPARVVPQKVFSPIGQVREPGASFPSA